MPKQHWGYHEYVDSPYHTLTALPEDKLLMLLRSLAISCATAQGGDAYQVDEWIGEMYLALAEKREFLETLPKHRQCKYLMRVIRNLSIDQWRHASSGNAVWQALLEQYSEIKDSFTIEGYLADTMLCEQMYSLARNDNDRQMLKCLFWGLEPQEIRSYLSQHAGRSLTMTGVKSRRLRLRNYLAKTLNYTT